MIPAFDRIDHIHLYATNRNKSEQWYADVMGFSRVRELESWAEEGPLTLTNSSGTVHIALFEAPLQACRRRGIHRLAPAPGRQAQAAGGGRGSPVVMVAVLR
jgi:catechol 2,3-dioxygenase-like lactoylglutathione lyase family enzyme